MRHLSKLSDEELVILVYTKNQELYEEIVRRYQNKLMRYVIYLIGNQHKAEDIIQETFIKAFVNLRGFNPKKKFSSWIYRIAHNEAVNAVKKHQREFYLSKESWLKKSPQSKDNIHQDLEKKETKKMVNFCLKELPFKYREPLILYYLEQKSYREISDILRISIGGLSARINRAKALMKTICQQNFKYEKRKQN